MHDGNPDLALVCRVETRLCALPIGHVVEIMRPLPVEPVAGAPHFVQGLAVVRGTPIPVVDAARLLGGSSIRAERFLTIMAAGRRIALAVGGVLGVRPLPSASLTELPPLLHDASADVIAAIGLLDAELLLVLRSARLLPDEAWAAVEAAPDPVAAHSRDQR
ncbi:MAG TPA: chemotaxis protein CheW [Albitalea sp.]|nr:chemotaxis protein CheW [Albitalea sp.]